MAWTGLTSFFKEARRRQVFTVLAIYVVGAWVVIQVAATLFPGWHIPDEAIRFVWIGALILFPVALVFGWYYELSAKGLRRTTQKEAGSDAVPLTRKDYLAIAIFVAVGIGTTGLVAKQPMEIRDLPPLAAASAEIPDNSIAVLPFVNMSGDEENEYFSDGITEQLLNELTRVSGLHVAARTSSFYYKGKNESMQRMGQQLGVRTLLEGSVRKSGKTIRITAQLINAEDGYHLWSETYDRALDDIFTVQDEISQAIVDTLKVEYLLRGERRANTPTIDNVEAYDLYLRAMAYRRSDVSDAIAKSNEYLQQVIDMAPDFALAYDALAYGYLLQIYNGSLPVDDGTALAGSLLEKALEMQPDLEQAHASLGLLKTRLRRYAEANEHYETALTINPNYFGGQVNYGLSLVHQGRLKEASAAYLRAQALDPLNANLNFNLGAMMMLMGEFDIGHQFIEKAVDIEPGMVRAMAAITHWLGVYGRLAEAVENGEKTLRDYPANVANIGALNRAYIILGMLDDASELLTDAQERLSDNIEVKNSQVQLWLAEGRNEPIYDFAAQEFDMVDANPGDPLNFADNIRVYRYAWTLLMRNENDALAEELFHWAAGGEAGIDSKTYDEINYLKMLALSYQRNGKNEEADALLLQCLELIGGARENGWATPTLFVRLAEVHALRSNLSGTIENLELAYEKGWRGVTVLETGVFWQSLQSNPDLERIKVRIYTDIEMQKQKLNARESEDRSLTAFNSSSSQH